MHSDVSREQLFAAIPGLVAVDEVAQRGADREETDFHLAVLRIAARDDETISEALATSQEVLELLFSADL